MKTYDLFKVSTTAPQSGNVLWVDVSSGMPIIRAFNDGVWEATSPGSAALAQIDALIASLAIMNSQLTGLTPLAAHVTYAELVSIQDAGELIPGTFYRITDYTTTTVQADTQSAGHNFDIIVTALSTNELSENAKCVRKSDDTYFTNAKLEAWEIKYCINNDTSRFAWADAVNGKGVIYYMKDEWGNECPYDFKNIQYQTRIGFKYNQWGSNYTFKRDFSLDTIIEDVQYYGYVGDSIPSAWSSNTCWLRDNPATTGSVIYNSLGAVQSPVGNITAVSNENYDVYTFSKTKTTSEDFDVSLNGLLYYCYNNTIRPYFTTEEHKYQVLNRITFVGWDTGLTYPGLYCFGNTFDNNCCDNTFGNSCYSNTFGNSCYSNTFGNSCYSNTFGNSCNNNTFGDTCNNNTFGNSCQSNMFGNSCNNNTFGDTCNNNTFGNSCQSNTFGNGCYDNTFGHNCKINTFGNSCTSNTFGDNYSYNAFGNGCSTNAFGNYCGNNTFGNYCGNNTFGDNCYINTFGNRCHDNTFGNGFQYNTFSNNCGKNNFYTGTSGTTKKDYIRYIVLEDGCYYNNFYSTLTTSSSSCLQRIRIKGLQNITATDTQITLAETGTNYEWLICYTSSAVLKQYCPND